MSDPVSLVRSALPEIAWPAVPDVQSAPALALQFQLELSQWYRPGQLRALQNRQLDTLLAHAYATVPYYRSRWAGRYQPGEPSTPGRFARLPVLTRGELQAHFEELKSTAVPPEHGKVTELRTSGSTGQPVRVLKTGLTELIWQAMLFRDHHWFRRDLQARMAVIRHGVTEGESSGWSPEDAVFRTGRVAALSIYTEIQAQLDWLERRRPAYLVSYPTNLAALARAALERGVRLPDLREVRSFGEHLGPDTRALVQEAWGVPLSDVYSTVEAGYIALQCPLHEHYHVQPESVLLEVLDAKGGACAPGETGRVVITTLHNFALPLIRYDMGDFAQMGPPCPCGRGLPVLTRIVGRMRNILVTASGERYWPNISSRAVSNFAPITQYQLVQKTVDHLEARIVCSPALTPEQERLVRQQILSQLPPGSRFNLTFSYLSEIPRSAGGKFEDFISEVAAGT